VGNSSKARDRLGWEPTVDFESLVRLLVDADVRRLEGEPNRSAGAVE
jgi:GDPmannose 4,6-dehydratase